MITTRGNAMTFKLGKVQWETMFDKIEKALIWLQGGFTALAALYVIITGVYRGITSGSTAQFFLWSAAGILAGILIVVIFFAMNLGVSIWGKSMDWLTNQLEKYPRARRLGIIPFGFIAAVAIPIITIFYWEIDNLIRAIVFIYFGLVLPSALVSMIREDRKRENSRLTNYRITPELIAQNPQAAIEHAFTLFEDHLRQRLAVGPEVYGEGLINLAFGQNGKLTYGVVESENKGIRNFMSGAYATFRNPRKHRIVQDNERTAFAIIALIELLIQLVDECKDQTSPATY